MNSMAMLAWQAVPVWAARLDDWIGYLWLALLAVWLVTSFSVKSTQRVQPVSDRLVHVLFTVAAFYLLVHTDYPWPLLEMRVLPRSAGILILGFVLLVVGVGFAVFARLIIGRNWSGNVTIKQDHELVCRGPYSLVRHPIYAGLLLAMLGTAIAAGSVHSFVGVLLAAIGFKIKSRVEERFMTEQFGAQYVSYRGRVKGLVPFVW